MSHTPNARMYTHGPMHMGLQDLGIGSISIGTKVITGGIEDTKGSVVFLQDLNGNTHPHRRVFGGINIDEGNTFH